MRASEHWDVRIQTANESRSMQINRIRVASGTSTQTKIRLYCCG